MVFDITELNQAQMPLTRKQKFRKWLRQTFCLHLMMSYLETKRGTIYKCCKCDKIKNI
jgi:hypothetical protein